MTPEPFLLTSPSPAWAPRQGHVCLFAQIDSAGDPVTFPKGGWESIKRDNNLALRSVHVAELCDGTPLTLRFLVAGDSDRMWFADLVLDARGLPSGLKAELTLPEKILGYAKFEGIKVVGRHLGATFGQGRRNDTQDRRQTAPQREAQLVEEFDNLNVSLEFEPGRVARIIDVELQPRSRHLAELVIHSTPGGLKPQQLALDIQHLVNRQLVGGLLYLLQPRGV